MLQNLSKTSYIVEEYHIGKEIEKEVRKQYASVDAFAKALHRERQTVYDLFKRPHIATDRLVEVSRLLKRDFFKEFSEYCLKGLVPKEVKNEENITESISQLIPEDKLFIIKPERVGEVADEYFLTARTKPLIVFCDNTTNSVSDVFHEMGENILGVGMIKTVHVNDDELLKFEAKIRFLAEIPQKAIEIHYNGSGMDGYDEIILLTEKLIADSGKFVILYCQCINALSCDSSKHIRYADWAERCFIVWHDRIHAFVADNEQSDFTRRQEIYHASMCPPCGYVDRALRLLDQGEKATALELLQEALFKRHCYKILKHEDWENNTHRFFVAGAVPTEEEQELLKECNIVPCLNMWFDIDKSWDCKGIMKYGRM